MSLLSRLSVTATRMSSVPPLTPLVTKAMQKLYPLALADRSWDNVGLLLEPPVARKQIGDHLPAVMLTIDLTPAVAKEALEEHTHIETIVSYRMPTLCYVW
jgi:putative NIF3 family GTP cyclohydrolase 1 type 2